jgi:hypothetical protein
MSRANHRRGDGTPKKGAKKGAEEANQAARDAKVLKLRRQGLVYREIGVALGCHPATACKAYRRALARLYEAADTDAEAIREEQTAGLFESLEAQEEVLMRLRAKVVEESGSAVPLLAAEQLRKAEDTYGRTWERVGKLWGTNAPTEVRVHGDLEEMAFAKLMEAGDVEGLRRVAEENASPLKVLMSRRGAMPGAEEG